MHNLCGQGKLYVRLVGSKVLRATEQDDHPDEFRAISEELHVRTIPGKGGASPSQCHVRVPEEVFLSMMTRNL